MSTPAPFTSEDFAHRMARAAEQAREAGLAGLLVAPGPDLVYFTGYAPMISERISVLVINVARDPVMLVPSLERSGAAGAPGVAAIALSAWSDGEDPYRATAGLLDATGRYAISDSAWALHLLGLQGALPQSGFVSMTEALPMLRAIKDADELERLTAAGRAVDGCFEEIIRSRFEGRREREIAADLATLLREHGHSRVDFTVVGSGPNGANPHHELSDRVVERGDMVVLDFGGVKHGYGSDITRTVHVGEPSEDEREVFEVVRARPAGRLRGGASRGGLPGDRPRRAQGDRRRRLRRVLHPPHRSRNRPHRARTAVHGGGGDGAAPAGDVLLDRARDLPAGPLRRADRGHRHGDCGRRPAPEQLDSRAAARRVAAIGVAGSIATAML